MRCSLERLEWACRELDAELARHGKTASALVYHRMREVAFAALEVADGLVPPPTDAIKTLNGLVNVHVLGFLRSPPLRPCIEGRRAAHEVLALARVATRSQRSGTDG